MKDIDKKNKNYKPFTDDGRTISNMNVEGFRWHTTEKNRRQRKEFADLNINKEERRAMMKGALQSIFPIVIAFIGMFLAIFMLIFVWLN